MDLLDWLATTAAWARKDLTLGVQAKLFDTIQTGWKLWVPAHIVNFAAVPSSQRVLYTNVVAVRSQHNMPSCCSPLAATLSTVHNPAAAGPALARMHFPLGVTGLLNTSSARVAACMPARR